MSHRKYCLIGYLTAGVFVSGQVTKIMIKATMKCFLNDEMKILSTTAFGRIAVKG